MFSKQKHNAEKLGSSSAMQILRKKVTFVAVTVSELVFGIKLIYLN